MPNPRSAAEWVRTVPLDCPHLEAREVYVCYDCAAVNLDAFARQQVEADRLSRKDYLRGPCPAHGLNFSLCFDCHSILVKRQVEQALKEQADTLTAYFAVQCDVAVAAAVEAYRG